MKPISFEIQKKLPRGRLGRAGLLTTPHGAIETPAFAAVGTKASVKSLSPEQVKDLGAQAVLANAYHLYLQPGEKVIRKAGGLGKFMNWSGPTMTDSGGFQAFSLGAAFGLKLSKISGKFGRSDSTESDLGKKINRIANVPQGHTIDERDDIARFAKITDDGVEFKSVLDGSSHFFTPERSVEIQNAIGADIIFAFDECTSPIAPYEYQRDGCGRTHKWAERSLARHRELRVECAQGSTLNRKKGRTSGVLPQALFGIVQGGRFEDLRKTSAKIIGAMPFDGFGIGGSFEKEDMGNAVRWVNEILPEEKPRHLLGIGGVADLFSAVENGCDTFDCVAPTREARGGSLYTKKGRINITNARFRSDFSPLEKDCECYMCKNFTRAYLAHLFRSQELLAYTLASIHNLHFFISLVKGMRGAILEGKFGKFKEGVLEKYQTSSAS